MLLMVYVSFMYGLMMPILFPICVIGLINISIVDKFALTYYFRLPPKYDGKLNARALKILAGAPILTFIFGYWTLSNTQMFLNIPVEKTFNNRPANPRHNLIDLNLGKNLNGGHMALLILVFFLLKLFLIDPVTKKFGKDGKTVEDEEEDAF
jgi:hypothetical protein